MRAWMLVLAACLVSGAPAAGYLKLGLTEGPGSVALRWPAGSPRYFIRDTGVPGVGSDQVETVVGRAFATWQAVDTTAPRFDRAGLYSGPLRGGDGVTLLGFDDRPDLERVLGMTSLTVDAGTGAIQEADVMFNASFPWAAGETGVAGRYDLLSIAVHEVGHLFGLGHSALGETVRRGSGRVVTGLGAVMFPVAFDPGTVAGRTLHADDVAGISDLYPSASFRTRTGSISGRITKNGRGLFGAHVVAFNLETGSLVGNFALADSGDYVIAGLEPGPTIVRVEPIDDADTTAFFPETLAIDVDFRVAYYDGVIIVPRAGNRPAVDIAVAPK